MSHESKPIPLGECSTRKETQRPSLARSLAAGHKWRACSQANTHASVKPCKYNQDISQQYGTNICNQCKRSTCRSWRVTQVVLATSELATCYESSDIHQSARCKEESKVHPDENKLCNAAPTNTYQTEQISLYVQNLWLTCELIHQKREQENDFRLRSFDWLWSALKGNPHQVYTKGLHLLLRSLCGSQAKLFEQFLIWIDIGPNPTSIVYLMVKQRLKYTPHVTLPKRLLLQSDPGGPHS